MDKLQDKIWVTRKSRIEASERLLRNDFHSNIVINYYAFFVVIISVYDLYNQETNISLLSAIGSILVLTVSIFISSKNFKERSMFLKACYLKLELIQEKIKSLNKDQRESKYFEIAEEYNDILRNSENHLTVDFTKIKLSIPKKDRQKSTQISTTEYISYSIDLFLRLASLTSLYLLPVIITLIFITNA